jgi:hypothetical protein
VTVSNVTHPDSAESTDLFLSGGELFRDGSRKLVDKKEQNRTGRMIFKMANYSAADVAAALRAVF